MQRWYRIGDVPQGWGPSAVTLGNFDGVHRGHQAVLERLTAQARARGLRCVAVTFDPHPVAVVQPHRAHAALATLAHRLRLLGAAGVDATLVMEFTTELAAWSPKRFVAEVFAASLDARLVVVGQDMRFGHRNSGDTSTLAELGREFGFEVDVVADLGGQVADLGRPAVSDGSPEAFGRAPARRWSSTWVRERVAEGSVDEAAEVLGRPHRMTGLVVHGDHRGRQLGFPTANLAPDAVGVVPADGVYAGWLVRQQGCDGPDRTRLPAAVSVGTNPTFAGTGRRVEAHVLDRDDLDLYGETVVVEFVRRLRPMVRFSGVAELLAQMHEDVRVARTVLGVPEPATDRA